MKNIFRLPASTSGPLPLFLLCIFALPLLLPLTSSAAEPEFRARIIGISDGDTISALKDGRQVKIRLFGIDCPEKSQDFGQRARQFTSDLTFEQEVSIKPVTVDRYGRLVAWVYTSDGKALQHELLLAGLAWHYVSYAKREKELAVMEKMARDEKRGLWSRPDAMAPWEYRKIKSGYHTKSKATIK